MGQLDLRILRIPYTINEDGKFEDLEYPHDKIVNRIIEKFTFFATEYDVDVFMAYNGETREVIDESLSKSHGTLKEDFLLQLSEIAKQIKEIEEDTEQS